MNDAAMTPDDRRVLYVECGAMLRMCDQLTASFIQVYAAISAALGAALGSNLIDARTFSTLLAAASLIFLLLSMRMRRNYSGFAATLRRLEQQMTSDQRDGPHRAIEAYMKRAALSPFPMRVLYTLVYVAGLTTAIGMAAPTVSPALFVW